MFPHILRSGAAALAVALWIAVPSVVSAGSWRPRLGIEAGPNLGRMNSTGVIGNGDHWRLGGSAGLVARWDLGPGWSLEAAPGWERPAARGTGTIEMTSTGGGGTETTRFGFEQTFRLDRIALPVRAAIHPAGSAWSIEGGISASWLVHADRTSRLTSSESSTLTPLPMARRRAEPFAAIFEQIGTFDATDWTHNFHRWDAAAVVGFGWDQPVATHVLRARLRWQQGLADIAKFDETVRVSLASAAVGLLW